MTTAIDWDNWGMTQAEKDSQGQINNLIISNDVDMDQSGSDFWNNYGDYSHYAHYWEDNQECILTRLNSMIHRL